MRQRILRPRIVGRRTVIAATVAAVLGAAGCQSAGADKAGTESVTLRLASIDEINDNGQSLAPKAFVDSLAKISGGKLKVQLVDNYGTGDPSAESALVKAIASGDVDGGWPATRAFSAAGINGLASVEAPMTITSYAAEKAMVSGPVADQLLATLDRTGVVGLGLAVGPLRRPFAAKSALLGAADWKGVRFRAFNSPVQSDAIRALGAIPVNLSFDWIDQARAGTLRGAEFDVAQYEKNGYGAEAGNVTGNVVLWPKVFVLSLSRKRFDSLSKNQQSWVREAAHTAVKASVDGTYDENILAKQLCTRAISFQQASTEQVASLRDAFAPVLASLAADPTNGPLLRQIQAIAAAHPQPDVIDVSASCPATTDGAVGAVPTTRSTLPDGVYRVSLKAADVTSAASDNGLGGTWTLTVRGGRYEAGCRPLDLPGKDCGESVSDAPLDVGDLRGSGTTVYFVPVPERLAALTGCTLPESTEQGHCSPSAPYTASWAINGDTLTFSDVRMGCDCDNLSVKPWRKIG